MKNILLLAFGLSGVAALIYEIIWARNLVLIFSNDQIEIRRLQNKYEINKQNQKI